MMAWAIFQGLVVLNMKKHIKNSYNNCVCSPKYGSMTFWKNKDFWQSMLLYAGMIGLLYGGAYVASLLQ